MVLYPADEGVLVIDPALDNEPLSYEQWREETGYAGSFVELLEELNIYEPSPVDLTDLR